MQRAFSIALSLAAIVLSAVLAFHSAPSVGAEATPSALDAGRLDSGLAPAIDTTRQGSSIDAAPLGLPELAPLELPETAVAPLGKGAPKHVRFGVVLVTYEGAEGAPEKGARHKSDALALAQKLAEEAKGDFRATVARGDTGSTEDVGQVARGVLEPASEATLFALPVGGISGVIDTPRGFWIVKRLE